MNRRVIFALAAALTLPIAFLSAAPAAAAPALGNDFTVVIEPGTQSGIGQTAWVSSLSTVSVYPQAATHVTADVLFEIYEGSTLLGDCTITMFSLACFPIISLPAFTPGEHELTYRFSDTTGSVDFSGSIFSVLATVPAVAIEWQDAAGNWIDGTGVGVPLLSSSTTAARCVVTNTSNAPLTFAASFAAYLTFGSSPMLTVPIVGTLAAGGQGWYPFYSGPAADLTGYNCGGGVQFPGQGGSSGNSAGGGIIQAPGTITASGLSAGPGGTVTIHGTGLNGGPVSPLLITLDGAPVAGSPLTVSFPGAFDFDVVLPAGLAPGVHRIVVQHQLGGLTVAYAAFTVTIPGLASGGVDPAPWLGLGLLLPLVGAALLVVRRRTTAHD